MPSFLDINTTYFLMLKAQDVISVTSIWINEKFPKLKFLLVVSFLQIVQNIFNFRIETYVWLISSLPVFDFKMCL